MRSSRGCSFNEAAASLPRKSPWQALANLYGTGRFNEAAASLPRKSVICRIPARAPDALQ